MSHHERLGGDQSTPKTCPFCGREIGSTAWPRHIRTCDGRDEE